jgi:hypothetical protein
MSPLLINLPKPNQILLGYLLTPSVGCRVRNLKGWGLKKLAFSLSSTLQLSTSMITSGVGSGLGFFTWKGLKHGFFIYVGSKARALLEPDLFSEIFTPKKDRDWGMRLSNGKGRTLFLLCKPRGVRLKTILFCSFLNKDQLHWSSVSRQMKFFLPP